jgi:hypothetical protein
MWRGTAFPPGFRRGFDLGMNFLWSDRRSLPVPLVREQSCFDGAAEMLQGALVVTLLALLGCQTHRPDFLTRVREDCAAGDQWACDLIKALRHPQPARDGRFH